MQSRLPIYTLNHSNIFDQLNPIVDLETQRILSKPKYLISGKIKNRQENGYGYVHIIDKHYLANPGQRFGYLEHIVDSCYFKADHESKLSLQRFVFDNFEQVLVTNNNCQIYPSEEFWEKIYKMHPDGKIFDQSDQSLSDQYHFWISKQIYQNIDNIYKFVNFIKSNKIKLSLKEIYDITTKECKAQIEMLVFSDGLFGMMQNELLRIAKRSNLILPFVGIPYNEYFKKESKAEINYDKILNYIIDIKRRVEILENNCDDDLTRLENALNEKAGIAAVNYIGSKLNDLEEAVEKLENEKETKSDDSSSKDDYYDPSKCCSHLYN